MRRRRYRIERSNSANVGLGCTQRDVSRLRLREARRTPTEIVSLTKQLGTGAESAHELLSRDKRAKVEAYGKQQRQRQR